MNDKTRALLCRGLRILLFMLLIPSMMGSLLGLIGGMHWLFDLANHLRAHYIFAFVVAAACSWFLRGRRMAVVYLGFAVLNAAFVVPLDFSPPKQVADADVAPLRLLHVNVLRSNTHHQAVAKYLNQSNADLVFVQEVDENWVEDFHNELSNYAAAYTVVRDDNFGIAVYVQKTLSENISIQKVQAVYFQVESSGIPALEVELEYLNQPLRILSIHTLPPMGRRLAAVRDGQLEHAAEWVQSKPQPSVILGDLNATPWSVHFQQLLRDGQLMNSQQGFGLQGSWPAHRWYLGMIPIDHCLHSDSLVTSRRQNGPDLKSDHLPLHVELKWAEDR